VGANLFNPFFGSTIPTAPGSGGTVTNSVLATTPSSFSSAVTLNNGIGLGPFGSPATAFSPFGVNGFNTGGLSSAGANGSVVGGGITTTGAGTATTTVPGTTTAGSGSTLSTTTTTGQFGPAPVAAFNPAPVFALYFGGHF